MNTLAEPSLCNLQADAELEHSAPAQRPETNRLNAEAAVAVVPGSIAQWLRGLGVFAVAASAVIFLLQGFNNIDLELRNWVYLALIAIMGGCGMASQKFMQDAKGSRLFFGLAVLLVPVQFSQFAGLVHDLTNVAGATVPNLWWLVAGTALLAVPLTYVGMAILARTDKRLLTGALLVMCGALLIPERNSLVGFVTLAGLAASVVWLELNVFCRNSVYASLEGMGLRLLLAVPFVIAAVRMSMHIDGMAGIAAMSGIVAVFLSRLHMGQGWLQWIAAFLGVASWWLYVSEAMPVVLNSDFGFCLLMLPSAIWFLDVARLSGSNAARLRIAACLFWVVSAGSLLLFGMQAGSGVNLTLVALLLGVLALVWGLVMNLRQPVLTGVAISTLSVVILVAQSLNRVEVNSWIALGLGGIALVFSASLVEKFGRPLLAGGQKAWQSMSAWD